MIRNSMEAMMEDCLRRGHDFVFCKKIRLKMKPVIRSKPSIQLNFNKQETSRIWICSESVKTIPAEGNAIFFVVSKP